jgi:hypothetical protein
VGGTKKALTFSQPSDDVENVDKNAENQNPHAAGKNAAGTDEKPNNSAAQPGVRDAAYHTPFESDDASLTPQNSSSEAQKPPQSNIVDLPIGAVPRRRKEAEP